MIVEMVPPCLRIMSASCMTAGSISSRASSGSRPATDEVEPTTSAKSTVTYFRSPKRRLVEGTSLSCKAGVSAAAFPHFEQNLARRRRCAPQAEQHLTRRAPHPMQNEAPAWFEEPQNVHLVFSTRCGPLSSGSKIQRLDYSYKGDLCVLVDILDYCGIGRLEEAH